MTPVSQEWVHVLVEEYKQEAQVESDWPTLLLRSCSRHAVWRYSEMLNVNNKGVPGTACRLLERYISQQIRAFFQEPRDTEEWARFKVMMAARFHLMMVSCIQLAAKMTDLLAPLSASSIRTTLRDAGHSYTNADIVNMEYHVYSILDFRIPLWTTLEICEFLAIQAELDSPEILEAVGLAIDLTEYYRDRLEFHMKSWNNSLDSPGSILNPNGPKVSLLNLHVCAGVVAATAAFMDSPITYTPERLAAIVQCYPGRIKALKDIILKYIIPKENSITVIRRRQMQRCNCNTS